MKRLLMIAFHYPPASGTSGVQRALRFSSHLPEYGWKPIVLTANRRAYEHCNNDLLTEIPSHATVIRAQAWDTRQHLSIAGRYPVWLALPDRWWTWSIGGIASGLSAILRFSPDVIWSTYPIATAHRIGTSLAKLSGLPFVADFRDPMAQEGYPENKLVWRSFAQVERKAIERAAISSFTTSGAVDLYKKRYPVFASRMHILENGYDEAVFAKQSHNIASLNKNRLTLLHSGVVYPEERDPNSLFAAMRSLRVAYPRKFARLVIRFRAAVHDDLLQSLARKYQVQEAIQILPAVTYAEAVHEMQNADGLLVLQASNCNLQVPAKFYEYLRAGPPILAVTDPAGDTASVARGAGISTIADFNDPAAIMTVLDNFLSGHTATMMPNKAAIPKATRRARTAELAELLDKIVRDA